VCSGHETSIQHFSGSGGPRVNPNKRTRNTFYQTCVFASGRMCGSRSAFWGIQGMKCRRTIFHAQVGLCGSHKRHVGIRYSELVFLHLVGSVNHVVRPISSEA
jgi:hypothetical protein